jgi:hypothetical protein
MSYQIHPFLAAEAGVVQSKQQYEQHPMLNVEMQPEAQAPEQWPVMERVNPDVPVDEVQVQQQEQAPVEQQVVAEQPYSAAPLQQVQQEDPKQRDWRIVRQRAEEAKQLAREKEAIERERDFYRQQALNAQQPRQQTQEEEYQTETERRLAARMKELEEQANRQAQQLAAATNQSRVDNAKARLAIDYPDYNQVLTDENIDRLKYEHPALYNAAISSNDPYAVGAAAYEFVVAKNIYQKPKNTLQQMTQGSASRNAAKPRNAATISPQSYGDSPIRNASTFMSPSMSSDEEKKNLYREMLIATGRG